MKKKKVRKAKRKHTKRKIAKRKIAKRKIAKRKAARKPSLRKTAPPGISKGLEAIGKVTHYFPKVRAGVVKIAKGTLALGETVHIKGHTTDFKQKINSIQLNHVPIQKAAVGQEVGILVKSRVRQNDAVYK